MASPSDEQFYAAWRHAYRRWNVIPTLAWPSVAVLEGPSGFWAQALAEARAWQESGLVPAPEADWPSGTAYPYVTSGGDRAAYLEESGTVLEIAGREVSRTLTGVSEVELPGSVAGCRFYDAERIKGLDPSSWYAYDPAPRAMNALHVEEAPAGMAVTVNTPPEGLARIHLRDTEAVVHLVGRLREAVCGVRDGEVVLAEARGGLAASGAYGAHVMAQGDMLRFHPAWEPDAAGQPMRGAAYARWELDLPADGPTAFLAEASVDPTAGDRTDGVEFVVSGGAGEASLGEAFHASSDGSVPIAMDLGDLAGQRVVLEILCDDGPNDDPSFDWARLSDPRLVTTRSGAGEIVVAGLGGLRAPGARRLAGEPARYALRCPVNGAVYLGVPTAATDTHLADLPWMVSFRQADGSDRPDPGPYAGLGRGEAVCGGVARPALHTHPPDRGQTVLQAVMAVPDGVRALRCLVGLRDGSKSSGVRFSVWLGGREVSSRTVLPGEGWQPLSADIAGLAGTEQVLELIADSAGDYTFDWACWAGIEVE